MRARQMYADGETVAAIRSETKLKLERIYYWVDGADGQLPALPRRLVSGPRFGRLRSRTTMVARMLRAAERQLTDIEQQLAANDMAPAEHHAPIDRPQHRRQRPGVDAQGKEIE